MEIEALWLTLHTFCMNNRIWYLINSLERQSVILELTASAAFEKQNPKQNLILWNSFVCGGFLKTAHIWIFFGYLQRFEITSILYRLKANWHLTETVWAKTSRKTMSLSEYKQMKESKQAKGKHLNKDWNSSSFQDFVNPKVTFYNYNKIHHVSYNTDQKPSKMVSFGNIPALWFKIFDPNRVYIQGPSASCAFKKVERRNSSLPLRQVTLKFCLPWKVLICSFNYLIDRWLAWSLAIRQVRMKSYLPRRKIYLSHMTRQHFYRTLVYRHDLHMNMNCGPKIFYLDYEALWIASIFIFSKKLVTNWQLKTIQPLTNTQ